MIYLQNLNKQFGPKIILKNANFHLRPNERMGLVGENGMGKTTLFRIIPAIELLVRQYSTQGKSYVWTGKSR